MHMTLAWHLEAVAMESSTQNFGKLSKGLDYFVLCKPRSPAPEGLSMFAINL